MTASLSFRDIKSLLQADIARLVRELAPHGRRNGKWWCAANPTREDRRGGSLVIAIAGGAPGAWNEYADGLKGDVIDLVCYLALGRGSPSKEDRVEALRWAEKFLNIAPGDPQAAARAKRVAGERREARARDEAADEARRARKAFDLWLSAKSVLDSGAETYWRARAIDWRAIAQRANSFRFHERLPYFHVEHAHVGPAVVAALRNAQGAIRAVHCTWLSADCRAKCPDVPVAKLVLGPAKGCAIWVSHGPSGLTPVDADAAFSRGEAGVACPLDIAEGAETALSLAQALPEHRVWAAYSLGNIGNLALPASAARVTVAGENDWGKPQAQKQLRAQVESLRAQRPRREVAVAFPFGESSDFNDLARI